MRTQSLEVCMAFLTTYSGSLRVQESREPLLDYMHGTSYKSPSSEAFMSNLNTYSDSLQKIEFDERNFIDMQTLSIFSSMTCRVTRDSLAELTLGSPKT